MVGTRWGHTLTNNQPDLGRHSQGMGVCRYFRGVKHQDLGHMRVHMKKLQVCYRMSRRGPFILDGKKEGNFYTFRVAEFACPRVLDDQKMSEDNQKM